LRRIAEEHTKEFVEIRTILQAYEKRFRRIEENLGGLSRSLGLLVENELRRSLKLAFQNKGYEIKMFGQRRIEGYQFDLYAELEKGGEKVSILGELKLTLSPARLEKFIEKFKKVSMKMPNVKPVIVFRRIKYQKEVIAIAEKEGVMLIQYLGDTDFQFLGSQTIFSN